MRALCIVILTLFLAPQAHAQGFLRALSNALSGNSNKEPVVNNSSATSTIGVRGVDDDDGEKKTGASSNTADAADLKALDNWSATAIGAEKAASKRGLVAQKSVSYTPVAGSEQ
ncbi:MAG TPA: hypothetical protein VL381_01305 [Rhodocyclaceae bacterium]|jgi:hypothetical protein|nr:hypothetical protein [Rhodocyclaceae bacterium]